MQRRKIINPQILGFLLATKAKHLIVFNNSEICEMAPTDGLFHKGNFIQLCALSSRSELESAVEFDDEELSSCFEHFLSIMEKNGFMERSNSGKSAFMTEKSLMISDSVMNESSDHYRYDFGFKNLVNRFIRGLLS